MPIEKSSLLAALAPSITTVDVDGFGPVHLRQISVAESDALRAKAKDNAPASEFGLRLLATSMVDENGAPIFTDEADLQALRSSSGPKVDKLVESVLAVNGFVKAADPKPAA